MMENVQDLQELDKEISLMDGEIIALKERKQIGRYSALEAAVFYLPVVAVAFSEIALLYNIEAGISLYGLTLFGLVYGIAVIHQRERRDHAENYAALAAVLKALMLLPLMRIIGYALPLALFRQIYWSVIVGVPILIAAYVLSRNLKLSLKDLGFVKTELTPQVSIVLAGIILGIIEYFILRPQPLISSFSIGSALLPGLILLFFTGFMEELIFRGFLQSLAVKAFGALQGVAFTAVLFTVMHSTYNSVPEMSFVFLAALFYGIAYQKTGSIYGVMLSHGLANIVLFLVAPFLF